MSEELTIRSFGLQLRSCKRERVVTQVEGADTKFGTRTAATVQCLHSAEQATVSGKFSAHNCSCGEPTRDTTIFQCAVLPICTVVTAVKATCK